MCFKIMNVTLEIPLINKLRDKIDSAFKIISLVLKVLLNKSKDSLKIPLEATSKRSCCFKKFCKHCINTSNKVISINAEKYSFQNMV